MSRCGKQLLAALCGTILSVLLAACGGSGSGNLSGGGGSGGGGGGTSTGANVATVTVDHGATGNSVNTLFVTLTVCEPGSSNCQTIDNIQVDTGSYGLRILSSVLTLALPTQTASHGGALIECTSFVDGYVWGPVALADVKVAGETASNLPIQVIGDSRYPNVPSTCSNNGPGNGPLTEEDTVQSFGANGILGVGPFIEDCGQQCADNAIDAAYYGCTSSAASSCSASAAAITQQVQSIVAHFATDNNGVIIQLPAVSNPSAGTTSLSGSLIFGIDTQANNASGSQTVLTTDPQGEFTASYNGQTLSQSFIDSGTNGIFFNDASLPVCTQSGYTDFYCPSAVQDLSVTLRGANGVSAVVAFGIGNTYTMLNNNADFAVFPQLGGTFPGQTGATDTFDLGLPFFYGRRVAIAMETATTSVGTGPYFAF